MSACIHQLNELGHCKRCGARPRDLPGNVNHAREVWVVEYQGVPQGNSKYYADEYRLENFGETADAVTVRYIPEPSTPAAKAESEWAIDVLDAWAKSPNGDGYREWYSKHGRCYLKDPGRSERWEFYGGDAARCRIEAARKLYEEDPSLPAPPSPETNGG